MTRPRLLHWLVGTAVVFAAVRPAVAWAQRDVAAGPQVPARAANLRGITIAGLHAKLQETPLEAVLRRLRTGSIRPDTSHIEGDLQLCYWLADAEGGVALRFYSSDLGGPEGAITAFELERRPRQPGGCARVSQMPRAVAIDAGIRLGMTPSELQRTLGQGTWTRPATTLTFSDSIRLTPADARPGPASTELTYWRVTASVRDNRLVKISVEAY